MRRGQTGDNTRKKSGDADQGHPCGADAGVHSTAHGFFFLRAKVLFFRRYAFSFRWQEGMAVTTHGGQFNGQRSTPQDAGLRESESGKDWDIPDRMK
jgi:hypothetical protein